jgi:hypothetical protein
VPVDFVAAEGAADAIARMTSDLTPGSPAEYERIPAIWRVAIACGKRNDAAQIRQVLAAALPREGEPLRDWQAVVIGGGIINGVSQQGLWPATRVAEVLQGDAGLAGRWKRALELASAMADDPNVPAGTRYDALRILGAEPWEKRGGQLSRYLAKGTHEELQMGAVSGAADVDSPAATAALIDALPGLTDENRNLALDALLRNDSRINALLDAVAANKVERAALGSTRVQKLTNHADESIRRRTKDVLRAQ